MDQNKIAELILRKLINQQIANADSVDSHIESSNIFRRNKPSGDLKTCLESFLSYRERLSSASR